MPIARRDSGHLARFKRGVEIIGHGFWGRHQQKRVSLARSATNEARPCRESERDFFQNEPRARQGRARQLKKFPRSTFHTSDYSQITRSCWAILVSETQRIQ